MKRTETVYLDKTGKTVLIRQSGEGWSIEDSYQRFSVPKLRDLHAAIGELLTDIAAEKVSQEEPTEAVA